MAVVVRRTQLEPAGTDNAEIEEAFRAHAADLWRALYVYTGGRGEVADEAVAEAFTRAIPQMSSIRDMRSWVYRVAFRVARTELNREHRPVGLATDLEPAHADREDLHRVLDALASLPAKQRAAIVLHYRVDLPVRAVAAILGVSTPTVKVHLHRARNRLRELLGSENDDE
jgi:RNA polymerase sigma-70 factor (ECF subfamily)